MRNHLTNLPRHQSLGDKYRQQAEHWVSSDGSYIVREPPRSTFQWVQACTVAVQIGAEYPITYPSQVQTQSNGCEALVLSTSDRYPEADTARTNDVSIPTWSSPYGLSDLPSPTHRLHRPSLLAWDYPTTSAQTNRHSTQPVTSLPMPIPVHSQISASTLLRLQMGDLWISSKVLLCPILPPPASRHSPAI